MKKPLALFLIAILLLSGLNCFATDTPYNRLKDLGEVVFAAPHTADTAVLDKPVSDYWNGWTTDNTYGTANYTYYGQFGDHVVQFYRNGKSTDLSADRSFFPNAQKNASLARLIAPSGGYGANADFVIIDLNFKVGNENTCYHDYYFNDASGKCIVAVRFDVNGMAVATEPNNIENIGQILLRSVTTPQHFTLTAVNLGGSYTIVLQKDGADIFTRTCSGSFNGFGGIDVIMGTYNGNYTHTAIGGLNITAGSFGENKEETLMNIDLDSISFTDPQNITADLKLESFGQLSGEPITWTSSDEGVITNEGRVLRADENKTVTMTASMGNQKRSFELTVLKNEDDHAYLFAYFVGNAAEQERLFYGVSLDGYNFRALNGGKSVFTSDLGTGCLRDPFIFKGEDGYYYIIATDMRSSLGWSSNYATVVFKTPDLIHMVDKAWIDYRSFPGFESCNRAWAPQAIWCPEKNAYMIYLSIQNPADPYHTVMYRHYATDLCDTSTYTVPELMLDEPEGGDGAIDGDIIYDKFHNEYIMFYCGKRIATAKTLSGKWDYAYTEYEQGQLPMYTSSGKFMLVEGSNIWKIIGRDKWIIAADGMSFNGGCYALVETKDFESYTQLWEQDGAYSFDFTPRHGYVIPISKRELDNLFAEYGEVELPLPKYGCFAKIEDGRAVFESPAFAKAYTAAYSATGELLSARSAEFTGRITLPLPEGDSVKAFLWDSNMNPLCEASRTSDGEK